MPLPPCPDCQALTGGELCRRCLVVRLFECVLEEPPDQRTADRLTADYVPAGDEGAPNRTGHQTLTLAVEAENMVGDYELLEEIARGGMGVVWRCRDHVLPRYLAMKTLKEKYRKGANFSAFCRRLQREARVLGELQHPGIVPIHQSGTLPNGRPFFVMKLVKGRTLADLLQNRPSPAHDLPRFLGIFEQVCQAMAYAHSEGVIHRDLKPANVMVGTFGEVQVMDWGLAKVLPWSRILGAGPMAVRPTPSERPEDAPQTYASLDERDDHTVPGSVMGTWEFMPPEQAHGLAGEADERSDVFGLGAMLCAILTGQPPYVSPTREDVKRQARAADLTGAYARLEKCGAGAELIKLAKRCLAPERADRPADGAAVAAAVAAYQAHVQERLREAERRQVEYEAHGPASACRLDRPREWARVFCYLAAWRVICHGVMALLLQLGPAPAAYWAWFIGLHVGTWLPVWWLLRSEKRLDPIERGALLNWGATFACDALLFALFCPPWGQVRPDVVVHVYSAWPAAHGLWYVAEGRRSWGRFYAVGLGYLVAAPLLSLCGLLAPVAYALVVASALLWLGDGLRRLTKQQAADRRAAQQAAGALPPSSGDRL
jgi:serine/threonine protein kinase